MTTGKPLEPDYYQILGLSPSASSGEVHRAFAKLIRSHREAPGETNVAVINRAREINVAHRVLGDREKRRAYDESRGIFFPPAEVAPERNEELVAPTEAAIAQPIVEPIAEPIAPAEAQSAQESLMFAEANEANEYEFEVSDETDSERRFPSYGKGAMLLGVAAAIALILAGTALIPQADHSSTTFPEASPGTKPPVQRQIEGLPRPAGPFQASNEALDRGEANSMPVLANDPGSTTAPEGRTGTKASPQSNITKSAEKPANAAEAQELAKESVTESGAEPSLASGSSENSATSSAPNSEPEMAANTKAELPPPPPSTSVVRQAAKSKPARYLSGDFMEKNGPVGRLQGTVAVRFIVDRNGRARGCRATGGSGNAALGTITCQLVEDRLRFEPALDSQGRPIQSELRTTYNWVRKRKR